MSAPGEAAASWPQVERDVYRQAMGRVVTGVMVLTTKDERHDHAMTVNSVASVSLEPPLLLAALHNEARSLEALQESEVWAINVLPASARALAVRFAEIGRPVFGQLDRVAFMRSPEGVALLDGATTRFHCRTWTTYPGGDHTICVGQVLRVDLPTEIGPALVAYRGVLRSQE